MLKFLRDCFVLALLLLRKIHPLNPVPSLVLCNIASCLFMASSILFPLKYHLNNINKFHPCSDTLTIEEYKFKAGHNLFYKYSESFSELKQWKSFWCITNEQLGKQEDSCFWKKNPPALRPYLHSHLSSSMSETTRQLHEQIKILHIT